MAREHLSIMDQYSIESPVATETRRLLHNLSRKAAEKELKSILITSATTAEGKSTISTLLAITAARKGLKTLLVDCDLRRPTLHKFLALDREPGIAEWLNDGVETKSVVKQTGLENLHLVSAGQANPSPTDLFDARRIGDFIREQKFYYDLILVDTPPVIPVSDPMLLAQEIDGTILVVKAGATGKEIVKRACDILSSGQARLLGVVLNNVGGTLPYYYDHSNYHYDYSPQPGKNESSRPARSKKKGSRRQPDAADPKGQQASDHKNRHLSG